MRSFDFYATVLITILLALLTYPLSAQDKAAERPNILFIITDDQSYPHASAYGCEWVNTPAFDQVATEGVLFNNCFASSPSCSPSRASILTGKNIWELEEAGLHFGSFPDKFQVFPDLLEAVGYHCGYTGKGWSPGNWKVSGRKHQPVASKGYFKKDTIPPTTSMSKNNYAENFADFLKERPKDSPFYFWCGITEPHRSYTYGSGEEAGKDPSTVDVPGFLLDDERTRNDLADYAFEIEYADSHIAQILETLEEHGLKENTLIIVSSDNGMPFPRAKIQLYEYSIHMPLAVSWPDKIPAGRNLDDLVSFTDLAPTILDAANIQIPNNMSGHSLMKILSSEGTGWVDKERTQIFSGRERHNYARADNMCYPIRCIRTSEYLYIYNFKPDRWPAGDPPRYRDSELGKPSGKSIQEQKGENDRADFLFHSLVDKRPQQELYAIGPDPACLNNLANKKEYKEVKNRLHTELMQYLRDTSDPRLVGMGNVFDSYPIYAPMKIKDPDTGEQFFPGLIEHGVYNKKFLSSGGK